MGSGSGPGVCFARSVLPKERLDIKSHETKNGTVCRIDWVSGKESLYSSLVCSLND